MYEVEAAETLPAGDHQVRLEFAYDGGGLGKGGTATLYLDGKQIAEGRVEHTHAAIFSADSTALVGNKFGAPIGPDLEIEGNPFNGTIQGVQIDLKLERRGSLRQRRRALAGGDGDPVAAQGGTREKTGTTTPSSPRLGGMPCARES